MSSLNFTRDFMKDFFVPPPTSKLPPCSWMHDAAGIVRPADCTVRGCSPRPGAFRFSPLGTCAPPKLEACPAATGLDPSLYSVLGLGTSHGSFRYVSCVVSATTVDMSRGWWREPGPSVAPRTAVCNNGTWVLVDIVEGQATPAFIRCLSGLTVQVLRNLSQRVQLAETRLEHASQFPWRDSKAAARFAAFRNATRSSKLLLDKVRQGWNPGLDEVQSCLDALIASEITPVGEPLTDEVCGDFARHTVSQLKNEATWGFANHVPPAQKVEVEQAVPFHCSRTVHRVVHGPDSVFYREGCFCDYGVPGPCPFGNGTSPSYRDFGFAEMEKTSVTEDTAAEFNSMCWYWTSSLRPELGYVGRKMPPLFQAPRVNSTDLAAEWLRLYPK